MATKNKNIKTYDLDSVFDEYMAYLSADLEAKKLELETEIEVLKEEISGDKQALAGLQAKLQSIITLVDEITKIKVLTPEQRSKLEADIAKAEQSYQTKNLSYEKLINKDTSLFTVEQKKEHDEKIVKAKEAMDKASNRHQTLINKLEADNKSQELLASKNEELKALLGVSDDSSFKKSNKQKDYTTYLMNKIADLIKDIQAKEAELNNMETEFNLEQPIATIETFKAFLKNNGLSTVHAEDLFKYRHNPEKFEKITYKDFKMRKLHPKRDFIIKKVAVPTAITSAAIGATVGAIASSGLVGGSTVLGFIPVSGTPGLTTMATTLTGAVAGLAATPTIIKGKNLITRTYYRLKAKSAVSNLEDYVDGIDIENLSISSLVSKIQETQHSILESRGPKNLILKIINRNRIHEVEAYTKELFEKYREIESDRTLSIKVKAQTLKPMYDLLANIEEFVANDIAESKTHAMLTCKENKKKHSHTYMIENVDIYANLKIYIDRLAKINAERENRATLMKNAKKATRNLSQKKAEAYKIFNGDKFITSSLNFENKYSQYFPAKKTLTPKPEDLIVSKPVDTQDKRTPNITPKPEIKVVSTRRSQNSSAVELVLKDGKTIKIPDGVDPSKVVATAKESKNKYFLTYSDGTKQEIVKKAKVLPEVEAARNVLGALLHDDDYIQSLKDAGFKSQTILALKEKLVDWVQNPTQKLILSGKVKELYNYAIESINAEAKSGLTSNN